MSAPRLLNMPWRTWRGANRSCSMVGRVRQGEYAGVLVADEDVAVFQDNGVLVRSLGNAAAPEQVAAALFAGLRSLETAGVQVILCRSFAEHGLGLAVRDRLLRAAGGRVFR